MCVIIELKSGVMIPESMLKNACHNNWHSYGLVTKKKDKLDIVKHVPPKGEVDHEEVFDLLQANIDHHRILHLRHNTAGATNLDNTHPFEVYRDKKTGRHIVFMHNGTMHKYKSQVWSFEKKTMVDDDTGASDTKNFVDRVLIPYISAMDFGNGKGDIGNKMFKDVIDKFWPMNDNRGVLIANDQDPVFFGTWQEVGPVGAKFQASNNQYFDSVCRGPEHSRRLVQQEKDKRERKKEESSGEITNVREFRFNVKHGFYKLKDSVSELLKDWDVYDRDNAISVGYLSHNDIRTLAEEHTKDFAALADWIFTDYAQLYCEHDELQKKHDKATNMIATLMGRLKKIDPDFKWSSDQEAA